MFEMVSEVTPSSRDFYIEWIFHFQRNSRKI